MHVDDAIEYLEQAHRLEPLPQSINFTGGEVFFYYDHLVNILERANALGLHGPYRVETNVYWCDTQEIAAERFRQLQKLNVHGVDMTADPLHLDFNSFERIDIAVRVARDVFGEEKVSVSTLECYEACRDYYVEHGTLDGCPAVNAREHIKERSFLYVARAATCVAPLQEQYAVEDLPMSCLGNTWTVDPTEVNQISVCPEGDVVPGACTGISIGNAKREPIASIIGRPLPELPPLVQTLIARGPRGLIEEFVENGGRLRDTYASVCHLCWDIRKLLRPYYPDCLRPAHLYEDDPKAVGRANALLRSN